MRESVAWHYMLYIEYVYVGMHTYIHTQIALHSQCIAINSVSQP